jgi:hypothetical protein
MNEQNFHYHQQWKLASPGTHDLVCRSIHTTDQDIKRGDWSAAISRITCAHITCETLVAESLENEDYTRFARAYLTRLMLFCIDKAPAEFQSQIPHAFRIATLEAEPWPQRVAALKSQIPDAFWAQPSKASLLQYRFPWSGVDPLCVCEPRAKDHWCGVCAHENPVKYTVGALHAL